MVKSSEIKLLGTAASPFVNRVQFVLKLKSIEYEYVDENLACKSELLLKSNPVYTKVPVLIHGNKPPIPESIIIVEYLDEIYPDIHPMLPSDPLDRAQNRFWADYIDTKYFPLYEELRRTPSKEGKEAIQKQISEGIELLEETFVKLSNGKAYFGGDDVGFLDVVLGCFLGWTKFVEKHNEFKILDEVRTPKLLEWANRIWSHEAFKDAIPGSETLMNFYMMLQKSSSSVISICCQGEYEVPCLHLCLLGESYCLFYTGNEDKRMLQPSISGEGNISSKPKGRQTQNKVGNVYAQFMEEEHAAAALQNLSGRKTPSDFKSKEESPPTCHHIITIAYKGIRYSRKPLLMELCRPQKLLLDHREDYMG
ncbi:hypothetical protein SSX86_028750 [Deinandra increscens subsp. villosa]|uniref:glutathione transferase n=1 Tax=Deinandra increscens subsp. villosa TaxID=3103831 RepID=A0AAP0GKS5_9ASTR